MSIAPRDIARRVVSSIGPLAPVLLGAVLLVVCFLSVSAALQASRGAGVADRSSKLDHEYVRALEAVAAEARAEAAYSLNPVPGLRDDYNAAARDLSDVIERLGRTGDAHDRRTARRIAKMHQEYLRFAARRFAAIDSGASPSEQAVHAGQTERLYSEVRLAIDAAARAHRVEASDSLANLRSTSAFVSMWVATLGGVGTVLVVFLTVVMISYRRQVQRALDREIARLEHAAHTDNLTGLLNHRALHEQLAAAGGDRTESALRLAVVALDLDGLKEANDTRGHHHGDELIRRLAQGLLDTMPADGSAFRIGGDEFVVLLPGSSAVEAFHYTQRLQTWLAPPPNGIHARLVEEPTHVTVGVSDLAAAGGDPALALRRADLALIEAKRRGHRGLIWSPGVPTGDRGSTQTLDQRRFLATALAKAVDAKDSYTRSHCETVSQLCVLIGERLGMATDDVERLRLAGLLHDVGKIGVPDSILQKPAALTDEEYEEMKSHSTLGASIVAAAQLTEEAKWVRHHHERLDGRGYPAGLQGSEIPLQSRIIFVADAFEAMTSDRPYRAGRPADEAVEELRRCAGTQFDAECVEALADAIAAAGPGVMVPASVLSPPKRLPIVATTETPDQIRHAA